MSRSEICAWQLGVDIEREVRDGNPIASVPERLGWEHLSPGQQQARFSLGDMLFSYWVLKGAQDAISETER